MESSLSYSRIKRCFYRKNLRYLVYAIGLGYILGIMLTILGLVELYKLKTFIIGQCQVKSIDFKFIRPNLYPRWNITVIYEKQVTNQSIISSYGSASEGDAWDQAQQYKINQTYLCYRSRIEISFISWTWRWEKPSKLEIYCFLCSGVSVLLIATIFTILGRYYQAELRSTQEQQQLEMSLRNEEQQQLRTPLESSPSSYDEAVRWQCCHLF